MLDSPQSLTGQVVLVSGAGRGIGYECAKAIAAAGATVALTARTPAQVEAAAAAICASGGRAHPFVVDIGEIEQHDALIDRVEAACGALTGLVNVAAVTTSFARAESVAPAQFDEMLHVNQRGTYFLTQAVAKRWLARESGGSVVTISSAIPHHGAPRLVAYYMTRAAVEAMTKTLAAEWAHAPAKPIRLNCVAPAGVETAFLTDTPEWYLVGLRKPVALRRLAQPEEIAGAVLYLLSDAAAFVTGTVIEVTGGYGMWSLDPVPKRE